MSSSMSNEAAGTRARLKSLHRATCSKIIREPLVHFLFVGAAIFGLYVALSGAPVSEVEDRITVTAGDVEQLRGLWERQWQRPPTVEELRGLVEQHVREEVLYREALALGLDRDDTIVRRRLAQKFKFLIEDLSAGREPTAEELAAFFDAHHDRYRVPPRLSFTQVYFSPDRRGDRAEADARIVLASLRAGASEVAAVGRGDRLLLDAHNRRQTSQEIAATFGQEFVDAVAALEPGVWSGPIASGYGLHLVRVDERIPGRVPALAAVEAQVRTNWFYEQRQRANEEIFRRLLARYTVVIEGDAPDAAAVAMSGTDQGAGE